MCSGRSECLVVNLSPDKMMIVGDGGTENFEEYVVVE